LTSNAEEQLRRYDWPGNIRELSVVIERAVMRRGREEIGAEALDLPSVWSVASDFLVNSWVKSG